MAGFETLATQHGTGFHPFSQARLLDGSIATNYYLRADYQVNTDGVCLGLASAFLLYSKKNAGTKHPTVWISEFMMEADSAWLDSSGRFHRVSDLQKLVAGVMQDQAANGALDTIENVFREGMWNVGLKYQDGSKFRFSGWGLNNLVRSQVERGPRDNYWLMILGHIGGGLHAVALRSMIHPITGNRTLLLFDPNLGVVQFQGNITCLKNLQDFMDGWAVGQDGSKYAPITASLYRFS